MSARRRNHHMYQDLARSLQRSACTVRPSTSATTLITRASTQWRHISPPAGPPKSAYHLLPRWHPSLDGVDCHGDQEGGRGMQIAFDNTNWSRAPALRTCPACCGSHTLALTLNVQQLVVRATGLRMCVTLVSAAIGITSRSYIYICLGGGSSQFSRIFPQIRH